MKFPVPLVTGAHKITIKSVEENSLENEKNNMALLFKSLLITTENAVA